jgi:hypothetical protein
VDKGYSVKEGYNKFLDTMREHQNSAKWKNVWNHDSLPKINFFTWTLVHKKILTRENLMKRGFHGPFSCPLCQNSQDNIHHLFWNFSFLRVIWNLYFGYLARKIRWPSTPNPNLGNWDKYYRDPSRTSQSWSEFGGQCQSLSDGIFG